MQSASFHKNFHVILPVAGFGASTRELPDYSIAAAACYVNALLQSLRASKIAQWVTA
ncbi:MAG: hypothetical protein U1F27_06305 [Turneriella sp.]